MLLAQKTTQSSNKILDTEARAKQRYAKVQETGTKKQRESIAVAISSSSCFLSVARPRPFPTISASPHPIALSINAPAAIPPPEKFIRKKIPPKTRDANP